MMDATGSGQGKGRKRHARGRCVRQAEQGREEGRGEGGIGKGGASVRPRMGGFHDMSGRNGRSCVPRITTTLLGIEQRTRIHLFLLF